VWQIVSQSPGFLGIEGVIGENGTELALARFDSPESVLARRAQPDHVIAPQRGRRVLAADEISKATASAPPPVAVTL
jgi:hypothetical protein